MILKIKECYGIDNKLNCFNYNNVIDLIENIMLNNLSFNITDFVLRIKHKEIYTIISDGEIMYNTDFIIEQLFKLFQLGFEEHLLFPNDWIKLEIDYFEGDIYIDLNLDKRQYIITETKSVK